MSAARPRPSVLLTVAVAVTGIVLAVLAVARGPSATTGPGVLVRDAGGAMRVESSRAGRAIVKGKNLRPGQSVRGSVVVENAGSVPASVALWTRHLRGTGPDGTGLADALKLRVRVRTLRNPRHGPRTLYDGTLAEMPAVKLGEWRTGRVREYTFRVELPDGGSPSSTRDDNAYQGSSAQVTFVWGAH